MAFLSTLKTCRYKVNSIPRSILRLSLRATVKRIIYNTHRLTELRAGYGVPTLLSWLTSHRERQSPGRLSSSLRFLDQSPGRLHGFV